MRLNRTPNGNKCSIPDLIDDSQIIHILDKAVKGHRQLEIAYLLINYGFVLNKDLINYDMRRFNSYINRVQKLFAKYNTNWKIYYGQLNNQKDYGYYLEYEEPRKIVFGVYV